MQKILYEVLTMLSTWKSIAKNLGVSNIEQEIMETAFRY